jgi:hypothetical protein
MRWRGLGLGIAFFVVEGAPAREVRSPPKVAITTAEGEVELETEVPTPAPPLLLPKAPAPEPDDEEFPNGNPRVKTPADEDLPAWCPVSGRLTVFESSDLAENLGLVPMGTFKKTGKKFSVAELMEARTLRE